MAAHVRLEGISTSMRKTLSCAAHPLARILLLSVLNMRVVNVFDEFVHVPLVTRRATVPVAFRYLFLEILLIETRIDRGARDVA